jgi:hypothetical protein
MGLAPLMAAVDEPFDAKRHQWADGDAPPAESVIAEVVATGYTYQGRLVRPVLVKVRNNGAANGNGNSAHEEPAKINGEEQLRLDAEKSM